MLFSRMLSTKNALQEERKSKEKEMIIFKIFQSERTARCCRLRYPQLVMRALNIFYNW